MCYTDLEEMARLEVVQLEQVVEYESKTLHVGDDHAE
jgi:hypothetical protein